MASQMLSGPDLGGGFLHQLSVDESEDASTFTFHAQDGGSDAAGPPAGPLDVFGYVHPPSACMFGGPKCWHRRFRLARSEVPRVRAAYNRSRFVMEVMIAQAYGGAPVPIEAGCREIVERIAPPLDRDGIDWYVGGSAAAWLQGARVAPHDLDLGVAREGVDRLGTLLAEYLIEPVAPTDWPGRGIVHGARAFVGTFKEGVRAEWSIALDPEEAERSGEWSGRLATVRTETLTFHGRRVRVSRLEYALLRAAERRRTETVDALLDRLREVGPDLALLRSIAEGSRLPAVDLDRLLARLGG